MGQQGAAQAQANEQEAVEESRTYVLRPDGSFIPLWADEDGSVIVDSALEGALESVDDDELRIAVHGEDAGWPGVGRFQRPHHLRSQTPGDAIYCKTTLGF